MVFAVPVLHQPFGCGLMVTCTGGGIEANAIEWEVIDSDGRCPQVLLNGFPSGIVAQAVQEGAEAIVVKVHRADRVTEQVVQGVGKPVCPVLHGGFAMVGLGENVGEPADGELAVVETLLRTVRAEMAVEQVSQLQAIGYANDQRDIVHAFVLDGKDLCHAPSIADNSEFDQSIYAKLE